MHLRPALLWFLCLSNVFYIGLPVEVLVSPDATTTVLLERTVPEAAQKLAVEVTGGSRTSYHYENAAQKKAHVAAPNTSHGAWWEGFLSGMTVRVLISPSPECVVMCYSRQDGGGCQVARVTAAVANVTKAVADVNISASTEDERLPPPLPWGQPELFPDRTPVDHVQLERMSKDRFVVCFDRFSNGTTSTAGCHLGVVTGLDEGGVELGIKPFAPALEMGLGRLVSVAPVRADRFAACQRPGIGTSISSESEERGQVQVSCRYAEMHDIGDGKGPALKWTTEDALSVKWSTSNKSLRQNATLEDVQNMRPQEVQNTTLLEVVL